MYIGYELKQQIEKIRSNVAHFKRTLHEGKSGSLCKYYTSSIIIHALYYILLYTCMYFTCIHCACTCTYTSQNYSLYCQRLH